MDSSSNIPQDNENKYYTGNETGLALSRRTVGMHDLLTRNDKTPRRQARRSRRRGATSSFTRRNGGQSRSRPVVPAHSSGSRLIRHLAPPDRSSPMVCSKQASLPAAAGRTPCDTAPSYVSGAGSAFRPGSRQGHARYPRAGSWPRPSTRPVLLQTRARGGSSVRFLQDVNVLIEHPLRLPSAQ